MLKTKNFKQGLIESIKVAGQMMINMAEDIAGKSDYISSLNVSINFDPEQASIPELIITRSHLPSREQLDHILDSMYERIEEQND